MESQGLRSKTSANRSLKEPLKEALCRALKRNPYSKALKTLKIETSANKPLEPSIAKPRSCRNLVKKPWAFIRVL